MIRMSKLADYGLVLMTQFPRHRNRGRNLSARQMARETGLPLPMVSKVMKVLTREGLLVSQRGVSGGYALSKDPVEITIGDVLSAMEGPIAMTECLETDGDCKQESFCPVRTNWGRINYAVRGVLDAISIADMVEPLPEQLVTLGGIEVSAVELSER